MAKKDSASAKGKSSATGTRPRRRETADVKSSIHSVYKDFSVWESKKTPAWHPIKKMRYVFFRMIGGCSISDALREIHWSPSEFWHLIDLKRNDPFRDEYQRAKKLQGRTFADSVLTIAEGRDRVTKHSVAKMRKIIDKGLKKARQQKSAFAMKAMVENLLATMNENDSRILQRNKLQIDAAKWMAKTSNPTEFAESSKVSLGGPATDGATEEPALLRIEFVGPDKKVVRP